MVAETNDRRKRKAHDFGEGAVADLIVELADSIEDLLTELNINVMAPKIKKHVSKSADEAVDGSKECMVVLGVAHINRNVAETVAEAADDR